MLADVFGVSVDEVDVAGDEGIDRPGRRWTAPVLCDRLTVGGDLGAWLEIQLGEHLVPALDTAGLAAVLAWRSGTVVFREAAENVPSAYWLVTPEGEVTRVRVTPSDGPDVAFTVDAVEAPVPVALRACRAAARDLRGGHVPTPTTDAWTAVADPERRARGGDPVNRARERLLLWERLVRRMAGGWAPTGRNPEEPYRVDLRTRDALEARLATVPAELRESLSRATGELDALLRAHPEDGGGELPRPVGGWWWRRAPVQVPWRWADGAGGSG